MGTRCFLLEPTPSAEIELRRYQTVPERPCPDGLGYHDARRAIGTALARRTPDGMIASLCGEKPPPSDPRWPTKCDHCDFVFNNEDSFSYFSSQYWQMNQHVIYVRTDTAEQYTLPKAPVGAMWYADWMQWVTGPDGRCLVVRLPGNHDWTVDGRASNCAMPGDSVHRCWIRHGTPPNVTVDKNGLTCQAGAGSIQTPTWHGYLRNGELVT